MKILRKLSNAVDEIIESHGDIWRSKQDFIEEAVREKLRDYDFPKLKHANTYEDKIRLRQANQKSFVEIFIKNKKLYCTSCEATKCYHVRWCWNDAKLSKVLKEKNAKNPF